MGLNMITLYARDILPPTIFLRRKGSNNTVKTMTAGS